jgi:hypothetical protein
LEEKRLTIQVFFMLGLTLKGLNVPLKGLNVPRVAKLDLGSVTWSRIFLRFFGTFCEHAPRNKLCGSTNFIIFGPMDQKLWMIENSRRSMGRAGMYCSQPIRVEHMCKNMWAGGRRKILGESSLGHPRLAHGQPLLAHRP